MYLLQRFRNQFKRYVYLNQTLKSIILCRILKIIPLFPIDFTR
ncbi:hypothetical protein Hdeb2414_s0015g00450931 [Helianthus debilis subsp. tardiflorus]